MFKNITTSDLAMIAIVLDEEEQSNDVRVATQSKC
jgi:hypothetical protein